MPRAKKGAPTRQARKRVLKAVRGHRGAPGRTYRLAKEALVKAQVNARTDRRRKKRVGEDFVQQTEVVRHHPDKLAQAVVRLTFMAKGQHEKVRYLNSQLKNKEQEFTNVKI
jgi:methylphosphotriester-DNA--protein-cysteine methyltransferase